MQLSELNLNRFLFKSSSDPSPVSNLLNADYLSANPYNVPTGYLSSGGGGNAAFDVNTNTLDVTGYKIRTGMIDSTNFSWTSPNIYSNSGMRIDLDNGSIISKQFAIDSSGNAYFAGFIVGGSLDIPNQTSAASWHVDSSGNMWSGSNTASLGISAPFRVTNTGVVTAVTLRTGYSGQRVEFASSFVDFYDSLNALSTTMYSNGGSFFMTGNQSTSNISFLVGATGSFAIGVRAGGGLRIGWDNVAGTWAPFSNFAYDMGAPAAAWRDVFTRELDLVETGGGTDSITFQAPVALGSSYTLTFPTDDGNANEVLTTNGSGVLSWSAAAAAGANTALSNLAAVAINTSLVSDTNATDNLGSSSIGWQHLYLAGTGNIYFNNNIAFDFSTSAQQIYAGSAGFADFVPYADAPFGMNLGSPSFRWNSCYFENVTTNAITTGSTGTMTTNFLKATGSNPDIGQSGTPFRNVFCTNLGSTGVNVTQLWVTTIGSAGDKVTIHSAGLSACPLPVAFGALTKLEKTKHKKLEKGKGHYGDEVDYLDVPDAPAEMKMMFKKPEEEGGGEYEDIDIIKSVAFLYSCIKELHEELKLLKAK